jgi:hypothetical protein
MGMIFFEVESMGSIVCCLPQKKSKNLARLKDGWAYCMRKIF